MLPSAGYSVNPSANTSASNRTGDASFYFGGIQTGGSSGGVPQWMLYAALGLAAFLLLRR